VYKFLYYFRCYKIWFAVGVVFWSTCDDVKGLLCCVREHSKHLGYLVETNYDGSVCSLSKIQHINGHSVSETRRRIIACRGAVLSRRNCVTFEFDLVRLSFCR